MKTEKLGDSEVRKRETDGVSCKIVGVFNFSARCYAVSVHSCLSFPVFPNSNFRIYGAIGRSASPQALVVIIS
jgi:hypothetical protein